MRQRTIGIIGGAGPLAGAALIKRILKLSQTKYGCYRDADYPKIILISYPFSEMLIGKVDNAKIQTELNKCLIELKSNGACVLAIACNTLHAFLDQNKNQEGLIQLPQILAEETSQLQEPPLVLCTSTSAGFNLFKRFFSCSYPSASTQAEVDALIDFILGDGTDEFAINWLTEIIRNQQSKNIVLGCTELSLFKNQIPNLEKRIIDPMDILSERILEKVFKGI